jgi:hypothetical protein
MKEYAGGINAILPKGIFSGEASSSKAKVIQAQAELKRLFEQSETFEEVVSIRIETINQTVVNAWRDCILNNEGLNAWYENIGGGEYSIAFRYTVDPDEENPRTKVKLTKVRIEPNEFIKFKTDSDRKRASRGFKVGGATKKIFINADSCRNYSLDSEGEREEKWQYGNVLKCSIEPPIPNCPSFNLKMFTATGSSTAHPSASITVDEGYKIIGGGAKVNWSGAGNLLTASFPSTETSWEARSKDHSVSSHANITVYAIGIKPRTQCAQQVENKIFISTTGSAQHPSGNTSVSNEYILTGGGALVNWNGASNLLTSSYPSSDNTWSSSSKDHSVVSPATINIYAIGIKVD